MDKMELQKLDYEKTLEHIGTLTEIRFKLLALVPLATGAALGLTSPVKDPFAGLVLGLMGFFVTLGIIFYDQRNSQMYAKQMHRARALEVNLQIPSLIENGISGGVVGGRPQDTLMLFGKYKIWHDRGLAFIYSSSLAVWTFLASVSLSKIITVNELLGGLLSLIIGCAVWYLSWNQIHKLDKQESPELDDLKKHISKNQKKEVK